MTAAKNRDQGTGIREQAKATEVREIPLEQLEASRNNPRRTMDEAGLQELAASIREHGVNNPLLVRPIDLDCMTGDPLPGEARVGDAYEIICGHRRSEAATIAGLTSVPCIVRNLDDATAAELALIDNLQRVDVDAIEEADALGELRDRLHSIQAVALKVGKEQSYVAQRLKLLTLTPWSRDALREKLITIDHALLLCRLAEEEQNAALKWTLDHTAGSKKPVDKVIAEIVERRRDRAEKLAEDPEEYSYYRHHSFEPQSVVRLKAHIAEDSGTPLDRAPWPLDADYLGSDAPACSACEKNTKANAPLFGDLDIGEPTCTDRACFMEKASAFVRIQARTSEGTAAPLRVSWKATSKEPRMGSTPNPKYPDGPAYLPSVKLDQVFKAGQWIEAKKACPNALQAVTIDWSDANDRGYMGGSGKLRKPGEILQVCVTPKCKVHSKAYEKTTAAQREEKSDAERKAQAAAEMEKFNAFRETEKPVREAVFEACRAAIKPAALKRNLLARALDWKSQNALCWAAGYEETDYNQRQKYVKDRIEKTPEQYLDRLLFDAAFGELLVIDANAMRAKDRGRAGLRELAKLVGVDAAVIERKLDKPEKAKAAPVKSAKKKPLLNAAARKRIADAQRKRWAQAAKPAAKKAAKKGGAK
jgi:ParB/RepB/Spo0J family partition protein